MEEASIFVKAAGLFDPTRGLLTYNQMQQAIRPGNADDDRAQNMMHELDSADHLTAMRKIKTQAMLNQFMTDSEDPISGYDPDRVASAFNEIATIAPRSAEHPGIMGPLLRRRLAGRVEPFEANELVNTESKMRELRSKPAPKPPSDKPKS